MAKAFLYAADEDDVLWVHIYDQYQQIDAQIITASDATYYNPATSADDLYSIEFNVINQHTASAVIVTVAVDPADGTAVASPHIWYNEQSIAAKGESGFQGPFIIDGTSNVNALADATDRGAINFVIKKLDDPLGTS